MQECVSVAVDERPIRAVFECLDGLALLFLDGVGERCVFCIIHVFFAIGICLNDAVQHVHVADGCGGHEWHLAVIVFEAYVESRLEE